MLTFFTLATQATLEDVIQNYRGQEISSAAAIFEVKVKNGAELKDLLSITQKIVASKLLYTYLNEVFADHLIISPKLQAQYNWPEKTKGLSEPQILFLLKNLPNYKTLVALLNEYSERISEFTGSNSSLRDEFINQLKQEFQIVLENGKIVADLQALNDPSKTLNISFSSARRGFDDIKVHFNRPRFVDWRDPSKGEHPAEDLKQIILDSIRDAKKTISFNAFEFNLMDIVNELEGALKRGVQIRGGIDKNTTTLALENVAVTKELLRLQRAYPGQMKITLVDPTGLNHQKIFVIDSGTTEARYISGSANLTQSCIGKEGDAVSLPVELRPKESAPNANNFTIVKGVLPALIAEHELNKILDLELRGQKGFPISGSYSFSGSKVRKTGKYPTLSIAFSPNGGMGHVSESIIRPLILQSKGQIFMMQFVASAPSLIDAIAEVAAKNPNIFDFKFIGDPPFSMQSWSAPLILSGMRRDIETKKYFENVESPMRKILSKEQFEELRSNIKINPEIYGDFHFEVEVENSLVKLKITRKMHDKITIFPRSDTAIIGTSFNPSVAAEGNQEQILWIKDHPLMQEVLNAFYYEFKQAKRTVVEQTRRRNRFIENPDLVLPKQKKPATRLERTLNQERFIPSIRSPNKCLLVYQSFRN